MKATPTTRTTTGRVQYLTTKRITRGRLGNRPKRVLGLDQLGHQVLVTSANTTSTPAAATVDRTKKLPAVHGNVVATPDLDHVACGTGIASTHTTTTTALVIRASHRRRCNGMIFVVGHCYSRVEILRTYALERRCAFFARARSVALRPDDFSP